MALNNTTKLKMEKGNSFPYEITNGPRPTSNPMEITNPMMKFSAGLFVNAK